MKKGLITLLVIGGVLLIAYFGIKSMYNGMVTKSENCAAQWANVETSYQRRLDLIPNLVNVVKSAANYEQETLTKVVEARASATSIQVDASNLSPENLQRFQAAQDQLSGALSRLLVSVERYPDLKANQNFANLMSQVEGTENRISIERRKFNETVKEYNGHIKRFPQTIAANMFGFDEKGYFTATTGAEVAPEVMGDE